MTEIYLGNPPEHIKNWIIAHSKPQLTELCFTAEEANSSVKLQKQGSTAIEGFNGLEYKLNDNDWTSYNIGSTITLENVGDKVYMRAVPAGNSRMGTSGGNYHKFVMTGKIVASGNINTLLNPDPNTDVSLERKDYCYYCIFYNCSSLTQAPELPATTLANCCYCGMFHDCSSLAQAPNLPATTLAGGCYSNMFDRCTSLTHTPSLPAMKLASNCYSYMFEGCTALAQAPELPAMTLVDNCYYNMFKGCSSLKSAPQILPATTLVDSCYCNMFQSCSSLTQAPELPATTLAIDCYCNMFNGCISLTQAPNLPATTLADDCYYNMFAICSQFSEVHMKQEMNGVYDPETHGDTTKTVVYDLA